MTAIGHTGDGFSFNSETPHHKVWLAGHASANRLVTNPEWLDFIQDGGYQTPSLWLSDGWAWVRQNAMETPLHWQRNAGSDWEVQFGLDGISVLQQHVPVRHITYYEAEAFARWAGTRLPTKAERESAAPQMSVLAGGFLHSPDPVAPQAGRPMGDLQQMFGDLWQRTGSSFLPPRLVHEQRQLPSWRRKSQ